MNRFGRERAGILSMEKKRILLFSVPDVLPPKTFGMLLSLCMYGIHKCRAFVVCFFLFAFLGIEPKAFSLLLDINSNTNSLAQIVLKFLFTHHPLKYLCLNQTSFNYYSHQHDQIWCL